MPTLYVVEQGSLLRRVSQRLVVEKDDVVLHSCPVFQIDRVVVFGGVQLTTHAMVFLMQNAIDVSFLSSRGRLRGRLVPVECKNAFLRLAQYDRFRDEGARLRLARAFIGGKLRNQRAVLIRHHRNHPEVEVNDALAVIDRCLAELPRKKQVESIMGLEGGATASYFRVFGQMLRKTFSFESRRRRPAPDPVNSLLSFGYVLVTNELDSLLEAFGFDPFIGFLHGLRHGRRSLALDLVEEFRHPLVDQFTLALINRGEVREEDFVTDSHGGVRMTPEALRAYLPKYEQRLSGGKSAAGRGGADLRLAFRAQAERLERAVLNDEPYEPFVMET